MVDSGTNDQKVTVWRVNRPDYGAKFCIFRSWGDVESEFDGADFGDEITVTMMQMTQDELEELPEFEGW
jgi:hypothetical protein